MNWDTMNLKPTTFLRLFRSAILTFGWLLISFLSFAHPMGNFSVSHYSGIRIEQSSVEVRYLIDMAEIPTFEEIQQNVLVADPANAETHKYVLKEAEMLRLGLILTLNDKPLPLRAESAKIIFPAGAGGLPTLKMAFVYRAALTRFNQTTSAVPFTLHYRDNNFPNRSGWKEIVVTAGSKVMIVNASVPAKDRSSELSNYPTDLLNSPPLDLEAIVNARWQGLGADQRTAATAATLNAASPGAVSPRAVASASHLDSRRVASPTSNLVADQEPTTPETVVTSEPPLQPNRQATPQNRFTQLMTSNQFGLWFLIGAAAIAAGLGALHALEPGHGKTIVAAYLVGSKGTAYHAFLLGLIVTVSHTASVYALGAVTLYASKYIVPEQLYPWLGAISGLLIAALGSYLFLQRYAGNEIGHSHGLGGHSHSHKYTGDHTHASGNLDNVHDGHEHSHQGFRHSHCQPSGDVSYRQLLALGITGGIVPCPAALVVLLSAVALNRVGFGLYLIVAFSIGLAAVLIAVGMLMVYARSFMSRFHSEGRLITRWLPLASAAVITCLGLGIAIRSLVTGGILQIKV
jgi:ABC-type nickel/cobalt efflux system permease component RcnA